MGVRREDLQSLAGHTLKFGHAVLRAFLVFCGLVVFAFRAEAQIIALSSPSSGCTAANTGAFDFTVALGLGGAVATTFDGEFAASETLSFSLRLTGAPGGFVDSATISDSTAGVSIMSATTDADAQYAIPNDGVRTFALSIDPSPDFGATISVSCATVAQGSITIEKMTSGPDQSFQFEGELGTFAVTTDDGLGTRSFVNLAARTYSISEVSDATTELTSLSCDGDTDGGTRIFLSEARVDIDLDAGESIICTFTNSVSSGAAPQTLQTQTAQQIQNFLIRRSNLLLSQEPDRPRYVRRFTGTLWGNDNTHKAGLNTTPFSISYQKSGDHRALTFSGSLSDFKKTGSGSTFSGSTFDDEILNHLASNATVETPNEWTERLDFWVEGHYSHFRDRLGVNEKTGDFGVLYAGVDFLLAPGVLVGSLVQYDLMSGTEETTNTELDGDGWMAGPYASFKLQSNLYFDLRAAWGRSDNDIGTLGSIADSFETTRWLAGANLTGNFQHRNWRITPNASIAYTEEHQFTYLNGLNILIPEQTVSLGRATFEPEISYLFKSESGLHIEPHIILSGIWDFDAPDSTFANGITLASDDFYGRLEGGVLVSNLSLMSIRATGSYDGIGTSDFETYGAQLWINLPLN